MQNKTLTEMEAFLSDNLLTAIEISNLSEVRFHSFSTLVFSKLLNEYSVEVVDVFYSIYPSSC